MINELLTVTVPDVFSAGVDTVLKAALYFDGVYADAFSATFGEFKKKEKPTDDDFGSLSVELGSQLKRSGLLRDLVNAKVVRPCPTKGWTAFQNFSTRDLPLEIRHAAAVSLRDGASFIAYTLGRERRMPSPHRGVLIPDPSDLNDAASDILIGFHLISIFAMLSVCDVAHAVPLVNTMKHAQLLVELAKHFPSVARALNVTQSEFLKLKTNAIAATVLRDTLPPVKPRSITDILALREQMAPELESFRAEMGRLATMIESEPWVPSFEKEVQEVVAKEVKPAFASLRRRLAHPSRRMMKHLIPDWKAISAYVVLPVTTCVFTAAPATWSILAGVAGGLGIAALKTKAEEWENKDSSSLAFLIEAERRLGK